MAVTSGPEGAAPSPRVTQRFGTIIVVGGGCYGSYYVRQLGRAMRAGAMSARAVVVVDRNPACAVTTTSDGERPQGLSIVTSEWEPYFRGYLGTGSLNPGSIEHDAIVPSPLMPHLMADWLLGRARERWPARAIATAPLHTPPAVPWQRSGDDGTHYVSFAEWMCPINCIEPARCPHTRGERSWSMPPAIEAFAESERAAGRPVGGPFVFHCSHRAFGVGMIDVRDVIAADAAVAMLGANGPAAILVGTASHCHGALRRIEIGA